MASTAPSSDFDPWTQPISLLLEDGSTYNTSMQDIDNLRMYGAKVAITYGSQIGATLILLLVLMLLTRAEKRRSSIFLVNAFCLVTNAIRCILLSCYVTSSLFDPYSQITGDFSRVTKADMATTVAANVFTLIVTILILVSLSTQVWVVCITTPPCQRYIIMGTTTVVALVAIGYKAAFVILNIMQTLTFMNLEPYMYVVLHSYITQAVAIWYFSVIFTYKLGYAIIQRRKLNMPQFGPMQILFIMGCQTMLVPGTLTPLYDHLYIANTFQPSSPAYNSAATSSNSASSPPPSSASSSPYPLSGPASST
jgi:pheromone alpha factor receptor